MAEVADGRTFHPRLTNLGTCEFGFALALPRFSEAVVEDVEPPSEPKIAAPLLDRLTKILQNTNVAYLGVSRSPPRLRKTRLSPDPARARSLTSVFKILFSRRSSTLRLPSTPPTGRALRDALAKRAPDLFHVTGASPIFHINLFYAHTTRIIAMGVRS